MTTKAFNRLSARERITQVVEGWFIAEPLLFAAWTMHDVVQLPSVATIRVGRGKVEYNAQFITSLKRDDLRSVLAFEAMRILLGHPYSRRQPEGELSYQASNLSVQECLRTKLPIPRAREVLGDESYDDQYFEFYYRELAERSHNEPDESPPESNADSDDADEDKTPADAGSEDDQPQDTSDETEGKDEVGDSEGLQQEESNAPSGDDADGETIGEGSGAEPAQSDLDSYSDPNRVGLENTNDWDNDDLQRDEINAAMREAAECDGWGTIGGSAKEQLLATLKPKLDYRAVLRHFRQSLLSVNRRLTRMKPNRRYGLQQMGSRYDFTTRLLFAVDVSGSMGSRDLQMGFSIVSRFFRYGIETIDVIWFDEEIRCEPMTLRRARSSFDVVGRGGTNFSPVVEYIDQHKDYDGLIVFTDGYAPVPAKPNNHRTQILWLFKDEWTYEKMHQGLAPLGKSAFLQESNDRVTS